VHRSARFIAILAGITLLAACSGGGGGSGDTSNTPPPPPPPDPVTSVTLSTNTITVSAGPTDPAPRETIRASATNMPDEGLYVVWAYSGVAVSHVDVLGTSDTEADLIVDLHEPSLMPAGTYTDQITFHFCFDFDCLEPVAGGPHTVAVNYTVTASTSVAASETQISAVTTAADATAGQYTVNVAFDAPLKPGPYLRVDNLGGTVQNVHEIEDSATARRLLVTLRPGNEMSPGHYNENIPVRYCYDVACTHDVLGSPFYLSIDYEVENVPVPEPGLTPVPVTNRIGLAHDVIDAEHSAALDAIVMVSAHPANALYLFDIATGTERQVALNKTPTAVSVAPDGLTAAVGHDALITHVDLAQLAATGTSDVKQLNISTEAFDVVLDGRGFVHVMPAADQWVDFHSVEVATNTETRTQTHLREQSHARLHPSGDYLYTADNGLSPSDIAKFDLTGVPVTRLYDSPYHGDYAMCGNLWFNESGITIYTACGNTFRATTVQAQDMVYSGALQLSNDNANFGFVIDALSESAEAGEIALIESTSYECQFQPDSCRSRLALYENAFLNRNQVYSLPPIEVAGHPYAQSGLFVFYSADGSQRLLISRLRAMPNPAAEYYISYTE
jgi:hypothetical protein